LHNDLFSNPIFNFLAVTIVLALPLLLGAMGGLTSERSGVINIGLEGMMLIAACACSLAGQKHGPIAGLAAGIFAAIILALLHWLMTQVYRIDHVISGMAINAFGAGGSNFLFNRFYDTTQSASSPMLPIWIYKWIAFLVPIGMWIYLKKTRGGLHLMAVGNDPDKARLVGIQPLKVRFVALLATGIFTGLGGVALVTDTGIFTDDMTAGKGYIALAALILGGWRPIPAMLACIGFAFFSALRLQLEGNQHLPQIPSEAWSSIPYLVTIIALAGLLGKTKAPAGLGKP